MVRLFTSIVFLAMHPELEKTQKLNKHTRRTLLPLGCGVFGEKTHCIHPCEAEAMYCTFRKTRDVETKQKGFASRLVVRVLAWFVPLAGFGGFLVHVLLWFRTLLFNAVLGEESRAMIFLKTFQP